MYAADDQNTKEMSKDCRTSLTISRADGTGEPQLLKLWQDGSSADQRFRELAVSSPETALQVEVSTDSPVPGTPCPRLLTIGTKAIRISEGPVYLLVPANQPIKLLFSAVDPSQPFWASKAKTFDGLSLGDGDLKAGGSMWDRRSPAAACMLLCIRTLATSRSRFGSWVQKLRSFLSESKAKRQTHGSTERSYRCLICR